MGRKIKTWEQLTNGTSAPTTKTLISKTDYNEIGQVLNKHLQSTDSVSFLQNIAYTYNERGWLASANAPLFAIQLAYYTGGGRPQYNGNISIQYWQIPGSSRNFSYIYDKLNRLTYGATGDAQVYKETGISYDMMGNLTALQRYNAGTVIDILSYAYTGNQLQTVTDATTNDAGLVHGVTAYTYDGNGNMLTDTNSVNTSQNKTFTYNLLNLPQTVKVQHGTVTYTYDAAGNKLRKVSVLSGVTHTTDYINGIEYDGGTTDTLNFIQTEEGKAVKYGSIYDYNYYLGDNLGNTRVMFGTKTGSAVTYQKDDYYPFGMEIPVTTYSPKNEYLYNKKELQEETQEYDYGARYYDPVIARWTTVDPLSEGDRRWSPYHYVEDNPIRFIDPDGMEAEECNPCDVPLFDRIVRPTTQSDRDYNPTKAAVHDFAYNALDFLGVKGLINAIGDLGNKKLSVSQKAAGVVVGVVNLAPIDGEGEREPNTTIGTGDKWNGSLDYSNLKEPNKIGDGLKTTKAQRDRILDANKKANGDGLRSDISGKKLDPPTLVKKGEKANMNQAEVDHIKERAKGGSNSNKNLRVVSKQENIDRNKTP